MNEQTPAPVGYIDAVAKSVPAFATALELQAKLIDLGERSPELFYNTGLLLQKVGQYEDAIRLYREAINDRPGLKVIDCKIPLSEMFGYATELRSMSQGRGSFTMEFDHYEPTPNNVAQLIIEGKKR